MDFQQMWRRQVQERLARFAASARVQFQEAGPNLLYGFLSAMALWPVARAVQGGELAALGAFFGVAGGVGTNLIANQMQRWQDEADAAEQLSQAAQADQAVREVLDALLSKLDVIGQVQAGMSDQDRAWFLETLRREAAQLGSSLTVVAVTGSGAMAVGEHALAVAERVVSVIGDEVHGDGITGDKVMGDKIHIVNQYLSAPGEPEFDAKTYRQALERYLQWVRQTYGQLNLRGIERRQEQVLTLSLDDVYVPLNAEVTAERAERRHLKGEGPTGERPSRALMAERHTQRISMRDLLSLGTRQVVIGGPGCGKTTVLRYIASVLARAILDDDPALAGEKLGLSSPLPLPVFIPLSEYNQHRRRLAADRDPRAATLTTFISHHLIRHEAVRGLPADFFERLLVSGEACMILMDGLDEVADERERTLVRQAVENLANGSPQARCVVTSRTRAYGGEAVLPEDFRVCSVQPLDEEHVETLVGHWCRAVYRDPAECSRESSDLLRAIRDLEALRREKGDPPLVDTPLLVTIMAIVHYNRRRLPDQRVELYDECVQVLLTERHHPVSEAQFALADWGGTMAEKRNLLSYLAFEMHQGGEERGRIIAEGRLRAVLEPRFARKHRDQAAERLGEFVRAVRERGSLLDERGGQYQFTHLSFQEFLAARYLAESVREVEKIAAFLEEGNRATDSWWREPILLLAGYLAISSDEQAVALLRRLNALTGTPSMQLAGAELAATALVEMTAPDSKAKDEVRKHLVALLNDEDFTGVTPRERARAGRALGLLGDPRDLEGLITIPAGEFWMGSESKEVYNEEKPIHRVDLGTYQIGKYPVTNAQYARFIEAGGYDGQRYWTEAGWAWRHGDFGERPEDYKDRWWEWIIGRKHFDRPEFWDDRRWNVPNHPVVGITWHEALAYTRWLTEIWRSEGRVGQSQVVRLPTEAEWEKAARGGIQIPDPKSQDPNELTVNPNPRRAYPWGDEFEPTWPNLWVDDEPVEGTSAVGIFPRGSSPYGCMDMIDNVREWTGSLWGRKSDPPPEYSYPYKPNDGREDLEAGGLRVLRAGSWAYDDTRYARCSYRYCVHPAFFDDDSGFRVVVGSTVLSPGPEFP